MNITELERAEIEKAVRAQIEAETKAAKRAYKAEWRRKNPGKISEANRKYYEKQKALGRRRVWNDTDR